MRISQISFCIARKRLDWADREKESQSVQIVSVWFMSERTSTYDVSTFLISHELVLINRKTLTWRLCDACRCRCHVFTIHPFSFLYRIVICCESWKHLKCHWEIRTNGFFRTSSTQKTIYTRKCNHTVMVVIWCVARQTFKRANNEIKSKTKRKRKRNKTEKHSIRVFPSRFAITNSNSIAQKQ